MNIVYENKVKAEGSGVHEFEEEKILIVFGENAPEELADYCYTISVNPIHGSIKPGQTLKIDDNTYQITAVGWEAPQTLVGLGHCTFKFNGAAEPDQPGTICVTDAPLPPVKVGSVIQILED